MRQGLTQIQFGEPGYLWLLVLPGILLLLWSLQAARRRRDVRRYLRHRIVPVRERLAPFGDLLFWLCLLLALTLTVLALTRPRAPITAVHTAGIDLVVLLDGSASMHVRDVEPDRWQRSMVFLRRLAEALRWTDDRIALTLFAHIAAPQVRLTRDPNTLFFFLDHLYERPPFRIEDETTWDTNLERAVAWGLRIVDKDHEIHGRSANAPLFVVISDGETWSGEVAKAVAEVTARGIPIFVVGVGTLRGGPLPAVQTSQGLEPSPGVSRLERAALQRIAASGHGQYFELDRDGDRYIANTIVAAARRLAPSLGMEQRADELYWWFLCGGAVISLLGTVFLRQRFELGILLGGGVLAALAVGPLLF